MSYVISHHIICHIYHIMSCHIMSYHISCHIYHIITYHIIYHIMSCHIMSYHIILYIIYIISYHKIQMSPNPTAAHTDHVSVHVQMRITDLQNRDILKWFHGVKPTPVLWEPTRKRQRYRNCDEWMLNTIWQWLHLRKSVFRSWTFQGVHFVRVQVIKHWRARLVHVFPTPDSKQTFTR